MLFLKSRSQHLLKSPLMSMFKGKDFTDFIKANPKLPEAEQLQAIKSRVKTLGIGVGPAIYSSFSNNSLAGDSLSHQYSIFDLYTRSIRGALLSFVPGTTQFQKRVALAGTIKAIENELKMAAPLLHRVAKTKAFVDYFGTKAVDADTKAAIDSLKQAHPHLSQKWRRIHHIKKAFNKIDEAPKVAVADTGPKSKFVPFDPKLGNWLKMDRVSLFHQTKPEIEALLLRANKSLEKEFNDRVDQTFTNAYADYKKQMPNYYQEYKNGEYAAYENRCNQKKAEIDKIYEPKAKSARTAIIVGAILSPLLLPLIAVGIGWWRLNKVKAKKAQKLAEFHTTLTPADWEKQHKADFLSREDWEGAKTYSEEDFRLIHNETAEGKKAHEEVSKLKDAYSEAIKANVDLALDQRNHVTGAPKTFDDLKKRTVSSLLTAPESIDTGAPAQKAPNNAYHLTATS